VSKQVLSILVKINFTKLFSVCSTSTLANIAQAYNSVQLTFRIFYKNLLFELNLYFIAKYMYLYFISK